MYREPEELGLIVTFAVAVYIALHFFYVARNLVRSFGSVRAHGVIDSVEVAYHKIDTLTRQSHGGKYVKRPSGFRFSYHYECRGRRRVGSSVYIDDAVRGYTPADRWTRKLAERVAAGDSKVSVLVLRESSPTDAVLWRRPSPFWSLLGVSCLAYFPYLLTLFDESTWAPWVVATGVVLGPCTYILFFGRYKRWKEWSAFPPVQDAGSDQGGSRHSGRT